MLASLSYYFTPSLSKNYCACSW